MQSFECFLLCPCKCSPMLQLLLPRLFRWHGGLTANGPFTPLPPTEPQRTDPLQGSVLQFKGEGRRRKKQRETLALQNNWTSISLVNKWQARLGNCNCVYNASQIYGIITLWKPLTNKRHQPGEKMPSCHGWQASNKQGALFHLLFNKISVLNMQAEHLH